jgi:PAS domain S-box-containing protein
MEINDNQIFMPEKAPLAKEKQLSADASNRLEQKHTSSVTANTKSKVKPSVKKYEALFHSMSYGLAIHEIICDKNHIPINYRYLDANAAYEKLTGFSSKDIIGKTALEVLPDIEPSWIDIFGKVALTREPCRFESFTEASGKYLEVLAFSPGKKQFVVLFNDITERRLLEKKLLETMVETEENERKKFAANLHDEVGPILSSLNLYISSLAESDDKNKKTYILPQMQNLIREAITAIRDLGNDLSPHVLLNNSLEKAIRSHLELCKELIPVVYRTNLKNKRFSHNIELVFYRIIKELLNNTIKHAKATQVTIDLSFEGNILKMKYADNGIGFDTGVVLQNSTGMGMINIYSRAKTINAHYLINTKPQKGFKFEIWTKAV